MRRGLLSDEAGDGVNEPETPPLHALYAASVRQRVAMGRRAGATVLRLGEARRRSRRLRRSVGDKRALAASTFMPTPPSVPRTGPKLERLCRYLLRPPVAEDRLSFAPDGSVLVRLKTPWRDGTSHIALQPLELLEKLAALIPRPYVNLIVYHGVLAPNAKWRREVVDFGRPQVRARIIRKRPHERSALRTTAPGPSSCAAASTSTCSSAPTAAGACGSWPPSCSRAPSAESSVISVFPQTQSSSRLPGHPPSSTTPGLVDSRSASHGRAIGPVRLVRPSCGLSAPLGCKHGTRDPFVCRSLSPSGSGREPNCAVLRCYVAWAANLKGRLWLLGSNVGSPVC